MSETIQIPVAKPPLVPKFVTMQQATIESYSNWTLVAVAGGILLLYSLSRIIALQRRVRDLEARPPVDDIVMRGMIRQQVSEMVKELEVSLRKEQPTKKNVVVKSQKIVPDPLGLTEEKKESFKKHENQLEKVVTPPFAIKTKSNEHSPIETIGKTSTISEEKKTDLGVQDSNLSSSKSSVEIETELKENKDFAEKPKKKRNVLKKPKSIVS